MTASVFSVGLAVSIGPAVAAPSGATNASALPAAENPAAQVADACKPAQQSDNKKSTKHSNPCAAAPGGRQCLK